MSDKIFKVEADGDTLFIKAKNFQTASDRLEKFMGIIPENLLKWSEVRTLPKGEELL